MNRLSTTDRVRVIAALIEGVGINATCRRTGVAKNTVLKLLADLGKVCEEFHNERVVGLKSKRIQCDEILAFCHCKKRNVPEKLKGVFGVGDVWTWTAIDPDSKLIANWHVGLRDGQDAYAFMGSLAGRFVDPIHITTDGLHAYWNAIINQVGDQCSSYAQCVKIYQDTHTGDRSREAKYSAG